MSKELIISITSQETKAAILENDQVVEIHIERDKEHGIVGAICKGRVTKVLPGMQSAFVDIGLERDAFLYVSDFFEDTEEYDKLVTNAEEQVAKLGQPASITAPPEAAGPSFEPAAAASNVVKYQDRRGRSRRSRRFRLKGKHYEGAQPPATRSEPAPAPADSVAVKVPDSEPADAGLALLPGESLAKYQNIQGGTADVPPSEKSLVSDGDEINGDAGLDMDELEAVGELALATADSLDGETEDADEEAEEEFVATAIPPSATNDSLAERELQTTGESEAPAVAAWVPSSDELASSEAGPAEGGLPREPSAAAKTESAVRSELAVPALPVVSSPNPKLGLEAPLPETAEASAPTIFRELPRVDKAPSVTSPELMTESARLETQAAGVSPPAQSQTQAASSVISGVSSPPSKVQFRNTPGTSKFFRRGMERRRRPNYQSENRTESESVPSYPLIGDLLKEGQEILVQIAKEPLGTKGARITSHIALPGRYLVYMPTVDHIGVSRKIESDEERQRLKRIIQENRRSDFPGGFIVRTAGQGKGEEEFKSDINFLYALWAEIKSRADKKRGATIVHRDLNLVQRILRDQLSPDFSNIRVDNEAEYAAIVEFINRFQPSLVHRVKLYTKDTPIFEEFGVQTEIDKALRNKVWLKSGGYIVIDQAEALVAIDVNTGKYVGKSNKLEDTIVKTNVEAAKEIARQIRLRDLGGIIVCDFIDMEDRKNRLKVTQTLEEALRTDKSPSKILQFNDFGLVAITRKRVKQSLMRALCEPCSQCGGSGMVKSPQTICYEIQGEVKKMAKTLDNKEITIRVSPEVAKALKGSEASVIQEIETTLKKDVIIKTDPLLHPERFDIF